MEVVASEVGRSEFGAGPRREEAADGGGERELEGDERRGRGRREEGFMEGGGMSADAVAGERAGGFGGGGMRGEVVCTVGVDRGCWSGDVGVPCVGACSCSLRSSSTKLGMDSFNVPYEACALGVV